MTDKIDTSSPSGNQPRFHIKVEKTGLLRGKRYRITDRGHQTVTNNITKYFQDRIENLTPQEISQLSRQLKDLNIKVYLPEFEDDKESPRFGGFA